MIVTNPLMSTLKTNFFPGCLVSFSVAPGVLLLQSPGGIMTVSCNPSISLSRCPRYPGQPKWQSPAHGSSSCQSQRPQPPCWKSGTPCRNPSHMRQTITASFTWPVSRCLRLGASSCPVQIPGDILYLSLEWAEGSSPPGKRSRNHRDVWSGSRGCCLRGFSSRKRRCRRENQGAEQGPESHAKEQRQL